MTHWTFTTANDDDLQDLLTGEALPVGYPWPQVNWRKPRGDEVGVLIDDTGSRPRPPACIVVSDNGSRRLFGRYSQLRSDLSPLSAWTHIFDWTEFEQLDEIVRKPELAGFEAAWVGLAVAEALILSERPIAQLKLPACLSTASFAIARARSLWPKQSIQSILSRYEQCQMLTRSPDSRASNIRNSLLRIWEILAELSNPFPKPAPREAREITATLKALKRAREEGWEELQTVLDHLELADSTRLRGLESMPAELRVKEFDRIVSDVDATPSNDDRLRDKLFFLAGYLATVAAGGAPSLSLAEKLSSRFPQITAWAYVIGSIGERVTWTSAFDGVGRLVSRELQRTLHIDEGPFCDFALAEAHVLVDRALQDPLVHLKVKQARVVTVALMPGVNVTLALGENADARANLSKEPAEFSPRAGTSDLLRSLARALAPYLAEEKAPSRPQGASRRSPGKSRASKEDDGQLFPSKEGKGRR